MSDAMVDGGCAWRLAMMPLEFGFPLNSVTEKLSPSEPVSAQFYVYSCNGLLAMTNHPVRIPLRETASVSVKQSRIRARGEASIGAVVLSVMLCLSSSARGVVWSTW